MKILFGVQATGNGHITRARVLNKQFKKFGLEVDYLFSGREPSQYFDMEEFGDWRCKRGLTFMHEAGELKILRTIQRNSLKQFWQDAKELSRALNSYDLVLTDFEPITAWAAKRAKKSCLGIGHQYAFEYKVPRRGDDFIPKLIMRHFAPTTISLGLHWHHFNQPILPPIAETHLSDKVSDPNKIVVYLGFESPDEVIKVLEPFDNYLFVYYGPFEQYDSQGHIQLKPLSREGFKQDLSTAGGVICNAGFELSSEALQLGKKLLIKPLMGQMEQLSNARALEELGLGMTMDSLDPAQIRHWLDNWEGKKVEYPNVAAAIVKWIAEGKWQQPNSKTKLVNDLWRETRTTGVKSFEDSMPSNERSALKTEKLAAE